MLKREHLKQAIDEIARSAPQVGYFLQEMFGAGHIDVMPSECAVSETGDLYFRFDDRVMTVRRFSFFNDPGATIEQQMLIQYGERLKKQEIRESGALHDYLPAVEDVRIAGLRFMVSFEIDLALARLTGRPAQAAAGPDGVHRDAALPPVVNRLRAIRGAPCLTTEQTGPPLFRGTIAGDLPAEFDTFPYLMTGLVQAAALNLDFFHVRFLLDLLIRGMAHRLFACLVEGRIAGLVFLDRKERLFYRALEIRHIAAARGALPGGSGKSVRGVGSFLVAGVWMLWRTRLPDIRELVLDSEIGARPFYESIGFATRRAYVYVLATPKGHLLDAVIAMAERCPDLPAAVLGDIAALLRRQIRSVFGRWQGRIASGERRAALKAIRRGLLCRRHRLLGKTAMDTLVDTLAHMPRRGPEADELMRIGAAFSAERTPDGDAAVRPPLLVVHDPVFAEHLRSIFHMDSSRRIQAVETALSDGTLAGKWVPVPVRPAQVSELAWAHTPEHIARIARTADRTITSLDLDTQTSARSFDVACRAVGGVFNLLDAVFNGNSRRGFAFVRPPGHHAEPDRAMGFCLFNTVALAARYLENVYGLERIMIVDIDAHHGNGTQRIFYGSERVLFVSMHQFPGYPGTGGVGEVGTGRGEGFTVNVPLPKGTRDDDFARVIHGIVRPIAEEYAPEAVLVSCGFDLHQSDRLSEMNATAAGYAMMTHFLKEIADHVCGGRLVFALEGGYNLRGIEECALHTLRTLVDIPCVSPDRLARIRTDVPDRTAALRRVVEIQRQYWKSLR